jgi:divalent metal cation (Fe/Co/Zn/Cd) transporter
MTNEETAVKATYFSIIGNACLALIKGTAGFGNSYALIDAIESTTDILLPLLVLFGIKYSRPADKTTHMDTVVQNLITFIVVGFLITSANYCL